MRDPKDCLHLKHGYCTWEQKFCGMTEPTWDGKLVCHRGDPEFRCPLCAGTGKEHDNDSWQQTPCVCQEPR